MGVRTLFFFFGLQKKIEIGNSKIPREKFQLIHSQTDATAGL
jgi:hypothetical protein